MEHPELNWTARFNYMAAIEERKHIELYAMDLLWVVASKSLASPVPMPSELWKGRKVDKRSAREIKADILKKFGGG